MLQWSQYQPQRYAVCLWLLMANDIRLWCAEIFTSLLRLVTLDWGSAGGFDKSVPSPYVASTVWIGLSSYLISHLLISHARHDCRAKSRSLEVRYLLSLLLILISILRVGSLSTTCDSDALGESINYFFVMAVQGPWVVRSQVKARSKHASSHSHVS